MGGGGGKGGSKDWIEKKVWFDRRGRSSQHIPTFVIDPERAKKLCLEKVKLHLGGGGEKEHRPGQETLGVGGLLRLGGLYGDADWTFGVPIQLLEDWCYALSTELQEVADSLGRGGDTACASNKHCPRRRQGARLQAGSKQDGDLPL